MDWEYMCSAFQ